MGNQIKHIRHSKKGKPFYAGSKKRLVYPSVDNIIDINKKVISETKVTKAEHYEILSSRNHLQQIIDNAKNKRGSVQDKAAVFLDRITKEHPFGSANRRTAYVVSRHFLIRNGEPGPLVRDEKGQQIMKGVREHKYNQKDISRWFAGDDIDEL